MQYARVYMTETGAESQKLYFFLLLVVLYFTFSIFPSTQKLHAV